MNALRSAMPDRAHGARHSDSRHRRGFTLIEMVIVLSIIGLVMAGAIGMMVFKSEERTLRDASGEVESLAKRARTTALLRQTPYAVEFREDSVRLLPLAEAGRDDKRGRDRAAAAGGEHEQYQLPAGMEVQVRRWDSNKWLTTRKDTVQIWRFDPTGLCEPLTVKFTLNDSWAEDSYHPLTASIREQSYAVK